MIGAGVVYYYGRQLIDAPGPLQEDKIVNVPSRAGMADIADVLQREGVIDVNPWVFIGGVLAMKASSDLKPGEYSFQKNASLRDVIATIDDGDYRLAVDAARGKIKTQRAMVERLGRQIAAQEAVREGRREPYA